MNQVITQLSKYKVSEVMEIARSLQRDIADKVLSGGAEAERLSAFKFRDQAGAYWTLEPRSLTWHTFAQGSWTPAGMPQGLLEGPANQAVTPVPVREPQPENGQSRPTYQNAVEALAASLTAVRVAYDQGQVTSGDAQALASLYFLVDKDTRLWTMGFHSGKWYFFDAGHWITSPSQLEPAWLSPHMFGALTCTSCGKQESDTEAGFCADCGNRLPPRSEEAINQVRAKLVELTNSGRPLPEPVTEPFDPPPGSPMPYQPQQSVPVTSVPQMAQPAMGICPNCGKSADPGARFCRKCGHMLGGTNGHA